MKNPASTERLVFNVGDEVEFVGRVGDLGSQFEGSVGTIINPSDPAWKSHLVCCVRFHSGSLAGRVSTGRQGGYCVYSRHLALASKPYDPTQAGDQDDDI